ncbi:MAG: DUF368 domain-containing protein [Clostridia bacterium]
MKTFIEILKGMLIGTANVIPGVSGGTIAVVTGIYDKLIDAINSIIKHPIKTIKEIWMYIVGLIIGIIFAVFVVTHLLQNYEIQTTALFVGLIIGALPLVIKNIENKKVKPIDITVFIIMMIIVIGLPFFSMMGKTSTDVNTNPILMCIIGAVSAATMIIPGVSGSMFLMTIGYYQKVMGLVSSTIKSIITLNISEFFTNFIILLPFAIGVLIGIILIAKLIKWLLSKYNKTMHWAILGLVVSSPFAVIMNVNLANSTIVTILISIVTFGIGYYSANVLSKLGKW